MGKNTLSKTPVSTGDKSSSKLSIYFLILYVNYLFPVTEVSAEMELGS